MSFWPRRPWATNDSGLPPGHAEQDPALWVEALDKQSARSSIKLARAEEGDRRESESSGQQHGFVPLDGEGRVISSGQTLVRHEHDRGMRDLRPEFGGSAGLIAPDGLDILPGFTAPKILWLKRHEPGNFARLRASPFTARLPELSLSGEDRNGVRRRLGTALMDVRTRRWSPDLCAFIDPALESKLPVPGSSRRSIGRLRPELAKSWGLSEAVN